MLSARREGMPSGEVMPKSCGRDDRARKKASTDQYAFDSRAVDLRGLLLAVGKRVREHGMRRRRRLETHGRLIVPLYVSLSLSSIYSCHLALYLPPPRHYLPSASVLLTPSLCAPLPSLSLSLRPTCSSCSTSRTATVASARGTGLYGG